MTPSLLTHLDQILKLRAVLILFYALNSYYHG